MRVLVVEDNALVVRLIRHWLGEAGHDVRDVTETRENWSPDVVLLDVHPWGPEWLDIVRLSYPGARVVIISGADEPDVRAEWAARGVTEWVAKPFTQDELVAGVEG